MNRPTDDEHIEKFARLLALTKIQEARIKANPLPFLNELSERCCKMQSAIEAAMYELSGASSFEHAADNFPDVPPGLVETTTIRNRKAHDVLARVLDELSRKVKP